MTDVYQGWSTAYNGNFPVIDGHHWEAPRDFSDSAICRDCGTQRSNNEIARGDVPECVGRGEAS